MSPPDRRPDGPRRLLLAAEWMSAAAVVAFTKFAPARRPAPLGPPSGHLADGLPPLLAALQGAPPAAVPTFAPPTPTWLAKPARVLAKVESALTDGRAPTPAGRRDWRRELPRPFAELRRTASPLIMPRLELPRVLASDFVALRGLAARARPGQAVQVKLTAYCLNGRTRRGTVTRAGIIAADTHLFPLARHVHLFAAGRYLGRFRVEDTGGGVQGPHIDIWTPNCADARAFGTRPGVATLVAFGEE